MKDTTRLKPKIKEDSESYVQIQLGEKVYQLCWDNRALYDLGLYSSEAETSGDYRKVLIFVWSLLVDPHPFKTPKDLTDHIGIEDIGSAMELVVKAMQLGGKNGMPAIIGDDLSPGESTEDIDPEDQAE